MLVFGGETSAGLGTEPWALSLGGTPTWTELSPAGTPPSPRAEASAIYDPARNRMIIFGGTSAGGLLGDTVLLQWGATGVPGGEEQDANDGMFLSLPWPNPSRSEMRLEFTLSTSGPARIDVFDVSGRRVRTLLDDDLAQGPHAVTWDGRDAGGRVLPPGIFFARFESGEGTVTRKLIRR